MLAPAEVEVSRPVHHVNIAHWIPAVAQRIPDRPAVVVPSKRDAEGRRTYRQITFAELEAESNRYARGLRELGVARGTRTVLMVRPSLEFFPLTFALYKIGAVPVLIDPGMGRRPLIDALAEVEPEAFIGISLAHAVRTLFPRPFKKVRQLVTVGRRWWWGGATLSDIRHEDGSALELAATRADEIAAILFTTGSTGPPKGVVYTHGIFDAQTRIIRDEWRIAEGEVDLPVFPLFALFSSALGATSVIPDMDPTRPAKADPRLILESIADHRVTYSFGSPAFWRVIADHCLEHKIQLPSLERVFMAGAPVPFALVEKMKKILPAGAEVIIPYGATESLPTSYVSGSELAAGGLGQKVAEGAGTCVGRAPAVNEIRIVAIDEDPIPTLDHARFVGVGEIGEIIVKGPVVTPAYHGRPKDTERAKIRDQDGSIWHRMGDLGYLDAEGRLWFCGRKAHRVETEHGMLCSIPCEGIFNQHPRVFRSALIGTGEKPRQRPAIVIELTDHRIPSAVEAETLTRELLEIGARSALTRTIRDVLFHPSFPVDIRHNAKIRREDLAVWAEPRLRRRG